MFKTKLVVLLMGIAALNGLYAQTDLGTHFMDNSWQSGITNPAWMPKHTFSVGLPNFHNDFSFSGFTVKDLIRASEGGQLDIDLLLNKLKADNFFREQLDFRSFFLAYGGDKFSFQVSHGWKLNVFFAFPRTFPELIWKGNAGFIGQEIAFAPDFQANIYRELAAGFVFRASDKVQIGLRSKWLSGLADISVASNQKELALSTSEDVYQLNMRANYRINHTGRIDYDGIDNFDIDLDRPLPAGRTDNSGWAIDVGTTIQLEPVTLSVGILDLGRISWKQDAGNLTLQGDYAYEGLDVVEDWLRDGTSSVSVLDTLESVYDFVSSGQDYTTALPTRLYASGRMQLDDRYSVGLLYVHELYRGFHFPYLGISANASWGKVLDAGLVIGYKHGKLNNIGLNTLLKLGPVQLLAATDNLLTLFFPTQSSAYNMRVGMNLVFGKRNVGSKAVQKSMSAEDFF